MSSRELVDELLGMVTRDNADGTYSFVWAAFLPEQSALNTALRGGDWSDEQYRQALLINELRALRWDSVPATPDFLKSPAELVVAKTQSEWQQRRHDEVLAELMGEGGELCRSI